MNAIYSIHVDNLKCGGCATTIAHGLAAVGGIGGIKVDTDAGLVLFAAEPDRLQTAKDKLRAMGYPETGSVEGLAAGVATAKSYVSCAIGKLG
jgi:copper chaperone